MRWRRVAVCAAVAAGIFSLAACEWNGAGTPNTGVAGTRPSALASTIYDPDPRHLWNRLHATIWLRQSPDGRVWGEDRLDPLLWRTGRHLKHGPSQKALVSLLDEFERTHGDRLVNDPLKRAVMQRDLWAVFDYTQGPWVPADARAEVETLQLALTRAMKRLALSADEIKKLPDNYAAAVKSGAFAKAYDQANPTRAFLPADLFAEGSPWICTGNATPSHRQAFGGRSTFVVFLKHPAGREAGLEYLNIVRGEIPKKDNSAATGDLVNVPNTESAKPRELALPVGTMTALVRQMAVLDEDGNWAPTDVIESIQFRVHRREMVEGSDIPGEQRQDMFELEMRRALLFAGKDGGFHARSAGERDWRSAQFFSHGVDLLEGSKRDPERHSFEEVLTACFNCHSGKQFTLNSLGQTTKNEPRRFSQADVARGLEREASNSGNVAIEAKGWKASQFSWGFWRGMHAATRDGR